jgi:hypothetical protein
MFFAVSYTLRRSVKHCVWTTGPWTITGPQKIFTCPKLLPPLVFYLLKLFEKVIPRRENLSEKRLLHSHRLLIQFVQFFVFVASLFYDTFSVTRQYSVDGRLISDWRWITKVLVGSSRGLILRYLPGIRLQRLRKTTKDLNQDSRSLGPRFEPETSWIWSESVNHYVQYTDYVIMYLWHNIYMSSNIMT